MISKKDYKGLYYQRIADNIEEAKNIVADEMSGEQLGLYCRYPKLNQALLKYWRFKQLTIIGGRSGSGKSMLLTLLRSDFVRNKIVTFDKKINIDLGANPIATSDNTGLFYPESRVIKLTNGDLLLKPINLNFKGEVILVHFGYDMDATDELLREASSLLGKSYGYILSAEYDKKKYAGYNKLSSEDKLQIDIILDCIGNRSEYIVPISGNITQMEHTVLRIRDNHPNAQFVFTLDHTLLTKKLGEAGMEELTMNLGSFGIWLKKEFRAMVIWLHQLNHNIEAIERKKYPHLHFPTKGDLYYVNHIWNACDNVMVLHNPKYLGIKKYGVDELITDELLHLAIIKNRFGEIGNIYFREEFSKGRIHQSEKEYFLASE